MPQCLHTKSISLPACKAAKAIQHFLNRSIPCENSRLASTLRNEALYSMSAKLKTHSADAWSQHATEYAKRMAIGPMARPVTAMLHRTNIIKPLSSARAILDLGCGPGTVTQQLLDTTSLALPAAARLVAGDLSPGMISVLTALAAEKATHPESHPAWKTLEPVVLDIQDLSRFPTATFSHVLAGFIFWFAPDPRRALREACRVMAPDGVLALTSWHDIAWVRELNAVATAVRPRRPARWFVPEAWASGEGVRAELEAAGFVDVEVEYVDTAFPLRDHEDFVRGAVREGSNPPIMEAAVDMTAKELDETCRRLVLVLKDKWPTLPAQTRAVAIVATAKKGSRSCKV